MLSPICSLHSLVTLNLSGIGASELSPRVRFCGGRDGHTDCDYPIIMELCRIAGSLQVPNLVSLDINGCHAVDNAFLAPVIAAPGAQKLRGTRIELT